ncbi:serine hydrolase domain-containing protein [Sphingorhabdus lacus]|uniref:Class A beta-lactamase-related serine hydrolase n=1 Tax=Sphingorhabdus lacus TaxID=392610 RepID=A0A6I6L441_9SPHN|nr:serine hydrolase domain-containing protein [Sphingorhabdus lacus]QGY79284.1 class A beta-lactamase-related serine hydrolase [Sphingorhabdus lacus]
MTMRKLSCLVLFSFALMSSNAEAKPGASSPAVERNVAEALDPYVTDQKLAGYVTVLMKDGRRVATNVHGYADIDTRRPMTKDTIFRIYSMTKPVTGVALMILHDQGKWKFSDPISKFLPELGNLKVYEGVDAAGNLISRPAASQPTMGQLVTHTAGFLYGFGPTPVDREYQKHVPLIPTAVETSTYLAGLAKIPLAYEPGTQWQYSIAMDLEGIIVERLSGKSLQAFMKAEIFDPLKMVDTDFIVPPSKRDRFASLYDGQSGKLMAVTTGPFADTYATTPVTASGGGGLVSTVDDYARFASMLLNGGTLNGRRILSKRATKTIMTNRLSPALINGRFGIGIQQIRPGYEYGVNGVVVTDPAKAGVAMGKGSYLWDGAAGTWFWVDPANKIVFVGMIQRLAAEGGPNVQVASQRAVAESIALGRRQ